jgi:hypothetical protein
MGTRVTLSKRAAVVPNNARDTTPRFGTPTTSTSAPMLSTTRLISVVVSPRRTRLWMAAGVFRATGTVSCRRRCASRINWSMFTECERVLESATGRLRKVDRRENARNLIQDVASKKLGGGELFAPLTLLEGNKDTIDSADGSAVQAAVNK